MKIIINDIEFPKEELLKLIRESKIQAIKMVLEATNIGLKDAKDIIDDLANDPNCYDSKHIIKEKRTAIDNGKFQVSIENGTSTNSARTKGRNAGAHVLKANPSKRALIIGILFLAILLFLIWAELSVGIFGSPFAGS
ncbi:ribosomal protein L7/L12 [Maribacter sp. 2308TA10-17]|uniref:ribosomal protein L7/L12 n=1 Tax=Maribacter sp. 2308TA10-17 TaxID=3386276 RepID=UPI0039BCC120